MIINPKIFSKNSTNLCIKWIDLKYLKYLEIDDYDGAETINICYHDYFLAELKNLVEDSKETSKEELLAKINDIITTN